MRIRRYLLAKGVDIKLGTIDGWLYFGKKPFKTKILNQISETSKNLTKEKAYVLGVLCGDGYISRGYRVGLEACDKEFVEYFQQCLERTYVLKTSRSERIRVKKPHYIVYLVAKLVVEDLEKYCSFGSRDWQIPKEIIVSNMELKSAFIQGFCDSEASVRYRKGSCEISIYSKNKQGLRKLRQLLGTFGINSKIILSPTRTDYLSIMDYRSLNNYHKHIGFVIKRKSNRLKKGLDSYKRKGIRRYSDKFKIKAMKLLKSGLSHREVSKVLETSHTNIYDWEKQISLGDA